MFFWHPEEREAHEKATARSMELLRDWLTPEQNRELEEKNYFTVRGSDTGERYRINAGIGTASGVAPYNISQIDDNDKVVARFCVVPQGIDTRGDTLLSQKIWFETDELQARCRANRAGWM